MESRFAREIKQIFILILLIILLNFSAVRPIKNREANYDTRSGLSRLTSGVQEYKFVELSFGYFWVRVPSISTSMSSASFARLSGHWIDPEKPCGSLVIIKNHTTTVCVPSSSSVSIDRTSA